MRLKKICALLLATALVTTGVTGCGGSDKKKSDKKAKNVKLTVWGPQEDQAEVDGYSDGILKAMCEKFNEDHPEWNITFDYGVCSEGDAKDIVTKDVAAAADVYMYANDQIPVLVDAGALSKLGGKTVDTLKSENDESMYNSVVYDGNVYGVPFTPNTWFMYYDKSKFNEDEVKSLDTMMEKDLGKDVSNFAFSLDNSWYFASFYYGAGCQLFGDGTDASAGCDFDNSNGVEVTKYLANLASNKKFSCEKDGSSIAKFKQGKLGAYCSGTWDASAIKEALGDNFGVTIAPTISINGTDGQIKSFSGSKAIGVNPNCKNQDVAVALAMYLGGKECQEIRFNTRGIAPTNKEVSQTENVQKDEVTMALKNEIENASVLQPVISEMGSYWTPAETMGKEIVQGNVNAKNAEDKTKKMVAGFLNK